MGDRSASFRVDNPIAEGGAYEVVLARGPSSRARLRALADAQFADRPRFLVSDVRLADRLGASVREALASPPLFTVPSGEAGKSMAEVERLAAALVDAGIDRESVLFALGGGALGDMAGFVAATLLRGIDYAHLPTTLLSMVDSSIGGKTAVNLVSGKNLVGAFHHPRMVFCDLESLNSLPEVDRRAGLAEVLKHALLESEAALVALEREAEALGASDQDASFDAIARSIAFKGSIVARDPREQTPAADGPTTGRIMLNLGHTIGHALESTSKASSTPLRHGEAVGLGLIAEAEVGASLGLWPQGPARIRPILAALGLPHDAEEITRRLSVAGLQAALGVDKKRAKGQPRYVLLEAPGRPILRSLDGKVVLEILLGQKLG